MTIGKTSWGALIAIACMSGAPIAAQDTGAGEAIAEKLCARCHAIRPGQKSRHGLAPTFPAIANRYSVLGLQEALAEGIVVGHADMPKFVFSPAEINNLLAFMDTFTQQKSKAR